MIRRVIAFSAHNRVLVVVLTVLLGVLAVQAARSIPLDAVPDLSDTQVIISSYWDRSPDVIEDQVTYPIVTSLLGAPRALKDLGLKEADLDRAADLAVKNPYWNPRAVERGAIRALLQRAWTGGRPE